ncbi:DNA/RNA nuclease SfsA [Butyrivibrio sp. WCE2006]|uniref:DNA/RNA nuclease SfsA n=1 Tax=Butyrivibrio sp. WCE2006 TaxID=1410611 RepID=UPI0005D23F48|nr:DNA/RNA nuclease SfsA [Butyrivibrio sp. WCE2006]
MKYNNVTSAIFISRPNRFIAKVSIGGKEETVHVKNTGRCKELLIPGCNVYLEKSDNPDRKTKYDLIAAEKDGRIINIDSQAPNAVVKEYLLSQNSYNLVKPEYKYGNSRIDFYMEKGNEKYLMEVKGCTLFIDGKGYFPDAPTERGAKHLRELTGALKEGYHARVAFVIQGEGIDEVLPNDVTDPEFAKAFNDAVLAGVEIIFYLCRVLADEIVIVDERVK